MKCRRIISVWLILVLIFCCLPNTVKAVDNKSITTNLSTDFNCVAEGSDFIVNFAITPNFTGIVNAFSVNINVQSENITVLDITDSIDTSCGKIEYYQEGNNIKALYLSDENGIAMESGVTQNIISLTLQANENFIGNFSIDADTYGVVDETFEQINISNKNSYINMSTCEYQSTDCRLSSLKASVGDLEPDFDENIMTYDLDVPNDTTQVTFTAQSVDPSTKVRVSRKTLYKAGTTTPITITVKASSGDSQEYVVNVYREDEKSIKTTETTSSKNSSRNSSSSKANTSSNTSSGKSEYNDDGNEDPLLSLSRDNLNTKDSHFMIYMIILAVLVAIAFGIVLLAKKRDKKNTADFIEIKDIDENKKQ